ncbi:MAG: DegT/DnrJ/EryC1/StrS family aminotransferase [Saprospiraceae bacterium]
MSTKIQMVDLKRQYQRLKPEIDVAIQKVLDEAHFINGPEVKNFAEGLSAYLGGCKVIPCANGTDALQIALMALELEEGDEVLLPSFTYAATAEVIALLKLKPVMVDVDADNFNTARDNYEAFITEKTRVIVPVHLFGQASHMDEIMELARERKLYVVEDNAQAIGCDYYHKDGTSSKLGTIGHIGCTSFFPSKNLGCYGDGGALYTNDEALAKKISMIANHGQAKKYHHEVIGCNSRLDTLQAAILNVKLRYLDDFAARRRQVADYYDQKLRDLDGVVLPTRVSYSNHVFHQYTLRVLDGKREGLMQHLENLGIPTMIYYPIPLYKQEAYRHYVEEGFKKEITEMLCQQVMSLPIHTEMEEETLQKIVEGVKSFYLS